MKLFSVTAFTIRDGDVTGLYVTNTEEEAMERFSKEFEDYNFYYEEVREVSDVDGYEIVLKKIEEQNKGDLI